ncbi:hypothetical protein [Streptomyces sp. WAC04114]|uniref:hypothetical protein n=1 Tax=Streptomyces sp. WAC04114 TaxID=2867961 RepID=UPI001C8BC4D4|nr:hypothetical protein [Streptomyces sp. WAC04114]MBX9363223.1 hypothetical protein [Streptomyces sp. WAC04114]
MPEDGTRPEPEDPALAGELRDLARGLTLQLTNDAIPDDLDAAAVRATLNELGLPSAHVSDTTLDRLRERSPDVVRRLSGDPSLAHRFDVELVAVANELDLPRPPGRGSGPRISARRARYTGRGDATAATALLDSVMARTLDDAAFAGAWQADPVAALIVHAADVPPCVLSLAIRRLLGVSASSPTEVLS